MQFDFTSLTDRRRYPSKKWTLYAPDVIPLWVADMDFPVAPVISEALTEQIERQPTFGYVGPTASLQQALCDWSLAHYHWQIEAKWQCWLPGVVPALHMAAMALTEPDEELLVLPPIYPPFLSVGKHTGRPMRTVPLREPTSEDPWWRLDRDALEKSVTPKTRMLLWCNPHNPTGRVFDQEELEWLGDFVERHDLLVCSDELHCDLLLDEQAQHVPLASLSNALAARTITLWAASKTFNIAGLTCACAVIPDPALRARFNQQSAGLQPSHNVLGLVATEAAYSQGEPWRQALLDVLRSNSQLLAEHVAKWPEAAMIPPQGSYLAWVDLRKASLGENPQKTLLDQAKVGLSDGADFGAPGFVRVNLATQEVRLKEALQRMDTLLEK